MTQAKVVYTSEAQSEVAGTALGEEIAQHLGKPDVVIVFASPAYDFPPFLRALEAACAPGTLVGCSSAGEFISGQQGEHTASAVALRSSDLRFRATLGRHLRADLEGAAQDLTAGFAGAHAEPALYHTALVLTDALAGRTDELIEHLNLHTGGRYRFFGGGAGDDDRFAHTEVFFGTEAHSDAAVALEILSSKPLGIGVRHGWKPTGPPMRVTAADGARLVSLNAAPAVEVFEAHAEATGQKFDAQAPLSFFLHNVLGIDTGDGYKLRVPLAANADGSITMAADVPEGSTVSLMHTTARSATEAAAEATRDALGQLDEQAPSVALFFDCVATRLRLGQEFSLELQALQQSLGDAPYAGCNTYGQVARAEGQFAGFHNCTAVVCVIPA